MKFQMNAPNIPILVINYFNSLQISLLLVFRFLMLFDCDWFYKLRLYVTETYNTYILGSS